MMQISDVQKIGVGLAGFGIACIILGVLLLLDKGLLAIGNLLFIIGLTMSIGPERTLRFFFQLHKIKGTCCFMGGIIVVVLGYPLIGMLLETYGFISLFAGFLPVALNFLLRVPLLGQVLSFPGIYMIVQKLGGGSQSMV